MQRGQTAQVAIPLLLRGSRLEPSRGSLPFSDSSLGPPSATVCHTLVVQASSQPPRSAERTDSIGRTTTASQRKQPETLRTQEPRRSLGQETSVFRPHPELIRATELHTQIQQQESWSHRSPCVPVYTEITGQFYQECYDTWLALHYSCILHHKM